MLDCEIILYNLEEEIKIQYKKIPSIRNNTINI